ncbi:hypothetical protein [Alicyclobacillus sp. SO9]|uniref:hypothetical protein n=1 Tax=Alicyclobacillus sp. SO9 TaxID=2665646 RepID=UPI0018E8B16A|nr:hypothetical protein [Alicyclobacillus sp. SO9]QQE80619.1 hypothetical protein GI364_09585 [Alicyclobacillus sp. SO9]
MKKLIFVMLAVAFLVSGCGQAKTFTTEPIHTANQLSITHFSIKPNLYYVLTATPVHKVGKVLAVINSKDTKATQSNNGWSTAIVWTTIEIREIPGVNVKKAVAVKTSFDGHYVKAVAQSKEPT